MARDQPATQGVAPTHTMTAESPHPHDERHRYPIKPVTPETTGRHRLRLQPVTFRSPTLPAEIRPQQPTDENRTRKIAFRLRASASPFPSTLDHPAMTPRDRRHFRPHTTARRQYFRPLPPIFRPSAKRPANAPQRPRDETRPPKIAFRPRAPQRFTSHPRSDERMFTTGGHA